MTSKLKVLDLFSGTQSIARAFRDNGHETYTIELDKKHNGIDWYEDIIVILKMISLQRWLRISSKASLIMFSKIGIV